jgi:hypothetical protein
MKGSRNAFLLAIMLLAASAPLVGALSVDSGRIRLVLHEGIGRFSLYARRTAASTDYVPLFVDRDPRTSGIALVINQRIYKLGQSSEFSEKVEKGNGSVLARFEWTSRTLTVVQDFSPVSATPGGETQGVRMSIRITNRSSNRISVGLRLCLDTYLGEDNLSHFSTDRNEEIRGELTVTAPDMVRYWLSTAGSPRDIGLLCITKAQGVTTPDRIVFANWKRLNESSWYYETSSKRNFNLMPYSINDSAVCMYYEPADLPAQGSREIVLVLGNVTLSGYSAAERVETDKAGTPGNAGSAAQSPGQPSEDRQARHERPSTEPESVRQDLDELNRLIAEIDRQLASGADIGDEELRLMEEILSAIKDKSERYSGGR